MNSETVIGALIRKFSTNDIEAHLIRASCENIYQWGRAKGMNEALETMQRDMKLEGAK